MHQSRISSIMPAHPDLAASDESSLPSVSYITSDDEGSYNNFSSSNTSYEDFDDVKKDDLTPADFYKIMGYLSLAGYEIVPKVHLPVAIASLDLAILDYLVRYQHSEATEFINERDTIPIAFSDVVQSHKGKSADIATHGVTPKHEFPSTIDVSSSKDTSPKISWAEVDDLDDDEWLTYALTPRWAEANSSDRAVVKDEANTNQEGAPNADATDENGATDETEATDEEELTVEEETIATVLPWDSFYRPHTLNPYEFYGIDEAERLNLKYNADGQRMRLFAIVRKGRSERGFFFQSQSTHQSLEAARTTLAEARKAIWGDTYREREGREAEQAGSTSDSFSQQDEYHHQSDESMIENIYQPKEVDTSTQSPTTNVQLEEISIDSCPNSGIPQLTLPSQKTNVEYRVDERCTVNVDAMFSSRIRKKTLNFTVEEEEEEEAEDEDTMGGNTEDTDEGNETTLTGTLPPDTPSSPSFYPHYSATSPETCAWILRSGYGAIDLAPVVKDISTQDPSTPDAPRRYSLLTAAFNTLYGFEGIEESPLPSGAYCRKWATDPYAPGQSGAKRVWQYRKGVKGVKSGSNLHLNDLVAHTHHSNISEPLNAFQLRRNEDAKTGEESIAVQETTEAEIPHRFDTSNQIKIPGSLSDEEPEPWAWTLDVQALIADIRAGLWEIFTGGEEF